MTYHFQRASEDDLIIVKVMIDGKYGFRMVLDTGASHTTIDNDALHLRDYNIEPVIGDQYIETANGITQVDLYKIGSISFMGQTKQNFPIQVYDFMAHGILSNYEGILGLDFFKGMKFCIDMENNTITMG
ncbi:MAG: retroviral-like aspartic protease family protein [Prevotellaceae bacterium]|jgi:predicted aspartyl protease|nr:retroviral-like aspartic protease family protein [Prevotellaceae bacterium]